MKIQYQTDADDQSIEVLVAYETCKILERKNAAVLQVALNAISTYDKYYTNYFILATTNAGRCH